MTTFNGPVVYMWDVNVPRGFLTNMVIELSDQDIADGIAHFAARDLPIVLIPNVTHLFNPLQLKGGDHFWPHKNDAGEITSVEKIKVYSERYYEQIVSHYK